MKIQIKAIYGNPVLAGFAFAATYTLNKALLKAGGAFSYRRILTKLLVK